MYTAKAEELRAELKGLISQGSRVCQMRPGNLGEDTALSDSEPS